MAGTSPNAILQIIKGVAKVPGDTNSAETGLDSINLLDPLGFSCDTYDIQLPNMKGGAVWADSPLTDGRTLISGTLGNVTETLRIQLTAGTLVQMSAMLSRLGRFRQDCNDFWDTFGQIEPVYIKHQVEGEPGPRYALLYNIEINVESPIDPGESNRMVTLSIEREYGWRGLAPGDNPKRWAIENVFSGQKFNSNTADLMSGNNFLHYETDIWNRAELRTTQNGYNVKNFVVIPGSRIPGDLPALLCLSYTRSQTDITDSNLIISKNTKSDTTNINRTTSTNQIMIHVFNAADASLGTDTTLAADTGASKGITGLQRRSQTTFATATLISRLAWASAQYSTNKLNLSVLRGRYAVFARARVSAVSTTCVLQLYITETGGLVQALTPVTFIDDGSSGTGNTTWWSLAYLGQVSLPSSDRKTIVSANGLGINVEENGLEITIALYASRTAGAGSLYVNDLIFMPIDEGATMLSSAGNLGTTNGGAVYDNTGYLRHGMTGDIAISTTNGAAELNRLAMSGTPIYLTPGVDNRIEFFNYDAATNLSLAVFGGAGVIIRASIVPRWSGLRDV